MLIDGKTQLLKIKKIAYQLLGTLNLAPAAHHEDVLICQLHSTYIPTSNHTQYHSTLR